MRAETPDRDAALIVDIVQAADDALEFVRDLDEAAFQSSRLHQSAVIRALEVIGEAAAGLSRRSVTGIQVSNGDGSRICAIG